MSIGDKDAGKHSTTIQSGSKPSVAPDDSNKGTQLRRGKGLAVLTVIDGPGAGTSHPLYSGDNAIGRSDQNRICLAFGDDAIHREGHAWISAKDGKFSIEHGGKTNPVHVNGDKLTDSRSLKPGDQIKLGKTTLRLDPA